MPPKFNLFKVGDRVKCTSDVDGNPYVEGERGTVVYSRYDNFNLIVDFDNMIGGHSGLLSAPTKPGHGWWIPRDKLVLEESEPMNIEITFDDIFKEET